MKLLGNNRFEISLSNIFLDTYHQAKRNKSKKKKKTIRTNQNQNKKDFAQCKKPSTKKGNLLNERRYLQIIHLIRG